MSDLFDYTQPLLLNSLHKSKSATENSNEKVYANAFKKLYYYLYSNSNTSRAERIISDLSNLLLCKIIAERNGENNELVLFIEGKGTANGLLFPILQKTFPLLIADEDKFHIDDAALRHGLKEIADLSFSTAPAHILGEAFQSLIGPRLRGDKGQFFTPKSLVRAVIKVLNPMAGAKIVDPACGTGGFLVEAFVHQKVLDSSSKGSSKFIGIDKDHDLSRLSEAILQVVCPDQSFVLNMNSLDIGSLEKLPFEISPLNADFVFTNPPFGTKIKITDKSILRQFALGYKWEETKSGWKRTSKLREAQDPQVLFIELCIRLLKSNGEMGIVLPEGVFGNHSLGYVWDFVRSSGEITALIDCPRTTFQPSTDTKTNVLFFKKYENIQITSRINEKIWTTVALHCGHDRRGRDEKTTGERYPDDFIEIGDSFSIRETEQDRWQLASITNPYYLVPRYYDISPIRELHKEADRLGQKLVSLGEMARKGYITIRKGHEVGAEAYGTGDIPFVRTSDISNYEISIDPNRGVSDEIYAHYARQQKLRTGDILMVSDGRYRIGRTAILHEHNYECVVQSHLRIISVAAISPIKSIELLYLLSLPAVQHQIRNLVFIQSTLGALGKRFSEIQIPIPTRNIEWDKSIADFRNLIEERANLLSKLQMFDHNGYEI